MTLPATPGEKSVSELFSELATQTAQLVRQEAALATREVGDKAKTAANQVVYLVTALLIGTASLLTLVAALVIGLAHLIPAWASAAIIGAVLAIVAYALYQKTLTALSNVTSMPARTVRSLQETQSWIRQQTR